MHMAVFSKGKDGVPTGRVLPMTRAAVTIIVVISDADKLDTGTVSSVTSRGQETRRKR